MGRLLRKKPPEKKKKLAQAKAVKAQDNGQAAAKPVRPGAGGGLPHARPPVAVKSGPAKANFISKSTQFLREVKVELKKVTWPSRKQAVGSTLVVIILTLIISGFLGAVDMGLSNVVRLVLG
ncbi:MAG: preprotein translocase subunit SecE [Pseudomonadota bacterium]